MRRVAASILLLTVVASLSAVAKDQTFQVVSWPDSGQPVLRFNFSKFKDVAGGMGKERTYISDVEAFNLSDKTISGASFSLYVFDKSKARIGEGYINLCLIVALYQNAAIMIADRLWNSFLGGAVVTQS